jgi:hypothetical protein
MLYKDLIGFEVMLGMMIKGQEFTNVYAYDFVRSAFRKWVIGVEKLNQFRVTGI